MIIEIYDNEFSFKASVPNYESVTINETWNGYSNFTITISNELDTAKYFQKQRVVVMDDFVGYIKKVTVVSEDAVLIVSGVSLLENINRLIYPPSGQETDNYTNQKPSYIVKELLTKNCVSPTDSNRELPISVATSTDIGTEMKYSVRYKPLMPEIFSILATDKLSLSVDFDKVNGNLTYDVVAGEDKEDSVELSLTRASLKAYEYVYDESNTKNSAVILGQADDTGRTPQYIYSEDVAKVGYDRSEVFLDARDVNSDDELDNRAKQKLSSLQNTIGINVEFNVEGPYTYGEDFSLGDFVSLAVDEEETPSSRQIIKAIRSWQGGMYDVGLILDFESDDLATIIRSKFENSDNLVATEPTDITSVGSKTQNQSADSTSTTFDGDINIENGDINIGDNDIVTTGSWIKNKTPYGYIKFGPANTSAAHIYTDRAQFYFDKYLSSTGGFKQVTQGYGKGLIFPNGSGLSSSSTTHSRWVANTTSAEWCSILPYSGSGKAVYINDHGTGSSGGEPTIEPNDDAWGYVGMSTRRWYRMYRTAAYTSSDPVIKTEIDPIIDHRNMLEDLDSINLYTYTLKKDDGLAYHLGVMVDELPSLLVDNDRMGEEKNIEDMSMTAFLLGVNKELKNKVENIEKKYSDLEERLSKLESGD